MQYFKDIYNNVFSYDDGISLEYILEQNPGLKQISQSEADGLDNRESESNRYNYFQHIRQQITDGFERYTNEYTYGIIDWKPMKYISGGMNNPMYYGHEHNIINNGTFDWDAKSYSDAEKKTFDIQYEEAVKYIDSGYSDRSVCPGLNALVAHSGEDLKTLVNKIIVKHQEAINAKFRYIGLKQKYLNILNAAKDDIKELKRLNDTIENWLVYK